MRIAVMGSGAVGGYFGAKLAAAGRCFYRPRQAFSSAESGEVTMQRRSEYSPGAPAPKLKNWQSPILA
jgi:ketopantoate reductase